MEETLVLVYIPLIRLHLEALPLGYLIETRISARMKKNSQVLGTGRPTTSPVTRGSNRVQSTVAMTGAIRSWLLTEAA